MAHYPICSLEAISADSFMFMNLLHRSQPLWLIQRAVDLLLCLSFRMHSVPPEA